MITPRSIRLIMVVIVLCLYVLVFKDIPFTREQEPELKKGPNKSEEELRYEVTKMFGVPFPNVRPKWMKNVTGRLMECDLYNEEYRLCIERNGEQHYKDVPFFGGNHEKQMERDLLKTSLCIDNGFLLVTVPYNVKRPEMSEFVADYIERKGTGKALARVQKWRKSLG